jgi:hypothetical protein
MPDFSQPVQISESDAARVAEICRSCGFDASSGEVATLLSLRPEQRGRLGQFASGIYGAMLSDLGSGEAAE